MTKILVVGGGVAGMFAAAAAAAAGAKVTLLEKNDRLGRKMSLTGGGRGNLTNTAPMAEFIKNIPGNGKFLYSALSSFSNNDCREFFESIGIPTKEEENGRVFPVNDNAGKVVLSLADHLAANHVRIIPQVKVTGLIIEENTCQGVIAAPGRVFPGNAVIIATGGASYPHTGSSGDGHTLAQQAGHRITPLFPSLVPLCLAEMELCRQLQGLSLANVRLSLKVSPNSKAVVESGEIIFTHFGLSGPAALRLSRTAAESFSRGNQGNLCLSIDLLPETNEEKLTALLLNMSDKQSQKTPLNIIKQLLPNRIAEIILQDQPINTDQKPGPGGRTFGFRQDSNEWRIGRVPKDANEGCEEANAAGSKNDKSGFIGKKAWRALAQRIKNLPLTVTGTKPLAEAMVTAGGVSLAQIDPRTMASRLVSGLYFAGEVLDLDAYSGGFNLQTAFSTGWIAGNSSVGKTS